MACLGEPPRRCAERKDNRRPRRSGLAVFSRVARAPLGSGFLGVGMTTAFVASSCSILLLDNRPKAGSVSATVGSVREQCARAQIHVVARHRQRGLEKAPLRKLHLDSDPVWDLRGYAAAPCAQGRGAMPPAPCFLRMGACGVAPSLERPSDDLAAWVRPSRPGWARPTGNGPRRLQGPKSPMLADVDEPGG